MCFALEKVYCPKGTFFEELCIEKEPSIRSEHFTVGIFAMSSRAAEIHRESQICGNDMTL